KQGLSKQSSPVFERYRKEGERWEFGETDFSRAFVAYDHARTAAQGLGEACTAKLSGARVLIKQGRITEAAEIYRSMLDECRGAEDADGMALSLYAAERLKSINGNSDAAQDFVI